MSQSNISAGGEALLRLLAFLETSPIARLLLEGEAGGSLFKEAVQLLESECGAKGGDANVSEALSALISAGLLSAEDSTIAIPGSVQVSVRSRIPKEHEHSWIEKALGLVFALAPPDPDEPRNWEIWKMLLPHVERVLQFAEAEKIPHPTGLLMGDRLGIFCFSQGQVQKAHHLFRRALEIDEAFFGSSHPNVAVDLNNLAATEAMAGQTEEAERLSARMTKILLSYDGPNDVRLAVLMANLADKLESQGNLEEAEQMHHHAIALDEACCGQLHPFCARESRRLAGFLVRSGRREEAVTLLQKALHADEQTSGSNHPYVAEDLRALGEVRVQMGQDDGLDVLLRRALEIDESWLAPDSPGVIQDLFHLAAFYTRRKQPNDAEIYLRRIIEIYDRYQPGNLAPLVISCHQLGEVHANRNEMGLALPLYCRALELEERAEGPLAEMAMLIRAALLRALRSQGQFQEAREIELRAAETWFRQAVEKDPRNVTMFVEYATFLKDQKADYDEAERWYRKALELGPNNPGVMNALGVFLTNIRGKHDEAQQLFIKTLELTPRDALVLCNLAFLLQNIRRDFENAERFYRMALENDPGQPFVNLNYATLKIVQGDLGSADKLLQKGWAAETGRRDRASARILLHKAILEQMQKHDCRLFLGQLKTLFKVGFAHVPWTGQSIVDFVGQKFPPGDSALFNAIIKAIGSLQAMPTLEALLAWKELPEAPLDASWETITEL